MILNTGLFAIINLMVSTEAWTIFRLDHTAILLNLVLFQAVDTVQHISTTFVIWVPDAHRAAFNVFLLLVGPIFLACKALVAILKSYVIITISLGKVKALLHAHVAANKHIQIPQLVIFLVTD